MLFRVDIAVGEYLFFDEHPDGVLFDPRYPTSSTGFKRVGEYVEYDPSRIPIGWWQLMKHDGNRSHPLEQILTHAKGYCDNVLWTRDERLAKIVAEACAVAKERSLSGRWPF